jgi:glycosyltransferase involved in cell wall biosynthesis
MPSVSVVLSTYNSPAWLEKVLWGYQEQKFKNFQLVIADDGSSYETRKLIEGFRKSSSLNIEHVWHEDNGCQKSIILNKAMVHAGGDYLIFSDGDCIPRNDFVFVHQQQAQRGHFLSGGHTKLPPCCSDNVGQAEILSGQAFCIFWLTQHGYPDSAKKLRITAKGGWAKILDKVMPSRDEWNNHNSSGWKNDLLIVNGFDERMQHSGEDHEMGDRLIHSGVKVKGVRYTAVCVHMAAGAGTDTEASRILNKSIQDATTRNKSRYSLHGIIKS